MPCPAPDLDFADNFESHADAVLTMAARTVADASLDHVDLHHVHHSAYLTELGESFPKLGRCNNVQSSSVELTKAL